jgi:hypothetical protein
MYVCMMVQYSFLQCNGWVSALYDSDSDGFQKRGEKRSNNGSKQTSKRGKVSQWPIKMINRLRLMQSSSRLYYNK